jgi:hypothetical protein
MFLCAVLNQESDATSPWYMFNDFVVKNLSEEEVFSFKELWKVRFQAESMPSPRLTPHELDSCDHFARTGRLGAALG